jgi:hypothetical protein
MPVLPPREVVQLLLHGHGIKLFPVAPEAKIPLIADNLRQASGALTQLAEWHGLYPGCNWGLACETSRLIVLDVDVPGAGHLEDGRPWLERMIQAHGDGWLNCPTTVTPSRGLHLYFGWPEGIPRIVSRNGTNGFALGVHVRASGAYVVTPPSTLRLPDGTLAHYRWVTGFDSQPPLPPDWLLQLLLSETASQTPAGNHRRMPPDKLNENGKILQGSRHCAIFRRAAALRARGLTEAEMLERVWEINLSSFEPPLSYEDCARQVKGAAKYPAGRRITCGGR